MGKTTVVTRLRRVTLAPSARVAVSAVFALAGAGPVGGGADDAVPRFTVHPTGFVPECPQRASDGTLPIRWSSSHAAWLSEVGLCRQRWTSTPIDPDPGWEGLSMHSDAAPAKPLIVRTCAEWAAARLRGRYAMTSRDMATEVAFEFASGMLAARMSARPAARSRFADFDMAGNAPFMLPPAAEGAGEREPGQEPTARLSIHGNRVHSDDGMIFAWIEPVLFGDLDGDGWEDMLALSGTGATQGTMRGGSIQVFTWIGDDPMVEITDRTCIAAARDLRSPIEPALWRESGTIAPLHEFALEGTCGCGGAEHRIDMKLSFDAGIASGSVTCASSQRSIPVRGCFGHGTGRLGANARYDGSGLAWTFEWKLSGGQLVLNGQMGGAVGPESIGFTARGTVLTPDERMRMEGWRSELRFRVADSNLVLRRSCGSAVGQRSADALCLESDGVVVELARLDRIEWGDSTRDPEADPATDAEIGHHVPRSVFRAKNGDQLLLLSGWSCGASTNNPMVIAVPIRDGRLCPAELQVFPLATVALEDGVASVQTHDLRAGADPYRDHPARPSVTWRWKGRAWSDG